MRIVLQHATNGLYVKDPNSWTADLAAAKDFGSSARAIRFMRQQRLSGVQVLVVFLDPGTVDTITLQVPRYAGTQAGPTLG